ncbi:homodimeric glycerol 3-phosphate dehydrogenase (quinone) [Arboricoccus pini]|uniref:Glycerol-3-phosphate dehydrogenase n=1 Tax=Arboricoccus pini TaxID=1963835 RepID=A0A212R503_9PROT|nr:glycerol-3-phosphate dehydrogenase [Arboricoccus pini]SNB67154.1 homodimeric glycerol 3-phosphate dehydrogenase (quinone) [Arboricoccus pini]
MGSRGTPTSTSTDDASIDDLLIVGGGINGVGIARDAAGRGLKVTLVEQDDLARHTSSWSSKLIHGGLRYLEHREFRLVREALQERLVLLRLAPHLVSPLRFVLPHSPEQRPAWIIRLGLFLYDHLSSRGCLPGSGPVCLEDTPEGAPLRPWVKRAFTYADCAVDDSRLVVVNAIDARERGARIRTRTRCLGAVREADHWRVTLEDRASGRKEERFCRILVNAAGPWVSAFLQSGLGFNGPSRVRLVKGSHIVVRRLYEGDHAYILQNDDRRIVFVIPYRDHYSLIGTTDVSEEGPPREVAISDAEIDYLCGVVNRYLAQPITADAIVWSFAGIRPLYDDASSNPSAVTRDYVFDLDAPGGRAPLLSIFGGKLTTYRRLAEHALAKLEPLIPGLAPPWTANACLPGGDMPNGDLLTFASGFAQRHRWLPAPVALRLARAYGTRADRIVGKARSVDDMGGDIGSGLTPAEIDYLVREEWVCTADDVLWRRTKLGLEAPPSLVDAIDAHIHPLLRESA